MNAQYADIKEILKNFSDRMIGKEAKNFTLKDQNGKPLHPYTASREKNFVVISSSSMDSSMQRTDEKFREEC